MHSTVQQVDALLMSEGEDMLPIGLSICIDIYLVFRIMSPVRHHGHLYSPVQNSSHFCVLALIKVYTPYFLCVVVLYALQWASCHHM